MKRKYISYPVNNFSEIKMQVLNWLKQFSTFCFLDNNEYVESEPAFECLIAAGVSKTFSFSKAFFSEELNNITNSNDWIFGNISYDIKNRIENLSSKNHDGINFPDLFFFVPEIVLILNKDELKIGSFHENGDEIFKNICSSITNENIKSNITPIKSRLSKEDYLEAVRQIKDHIQRGDCYELNFCQEFYLDNTSIDPWEIYNNLDAVSPNPFSAFYRLNDKYLLSASPERYLRKKNNKIFSQPIKGTSQRNLTNARDDKKSRDNLFKSEKERSENVMIVDLVRNDLSKICEEKSVKVDELFGIYSFPNVHQMISTISGTLRKNIFFGDIIKATFPMGSMTGAPKKKAMELIEKYEKTKRGLFSGSVGYINPQGDFDFNVIIRSILYNESEKYISIQSGSAITFKSEALSEYRECLLKIESIKKVLN